MARQEPMGRFDPQAETEQEEEADRLWNNAE